MGHPPAVALRGYQRCKRSYLQSVGGLLHQRCKRSYTFKSLYHIDFDIYNKNGDFNDQNTQIRLIFLTPQKCVLLL